MSAEDSLVNCAIRGGWFYGCLIRIARIWEIKELGHFSTHEMVKATAIQTVLASNALQYSQRFLRLPDIDTSDGILEMCRNFRNTILYYGLDMMDTWFSMDDPANIDPDSYEVSPCIADSHGWSKSPTKLYYIAAMQESFKHMFMCNLSRHAVTELSAVFRMFKRPVRVLDFGCGTGHYVEFFSSLDLDIESYIGIDRSDVLHEAQNPNNNIPSPRIGKNVKSFELTSRKLEETDKFDIVWLSEVIHGKTEETIYPLLSGICEHIAEDGILAIHEVAEFGVRHPLFDMHMALHCGGQLHQWKYEYQDALRSLGFARAWRVLPISSNTTCECWTRDPNVRA